MKKIILAFALVAGMVNLADAQAKTELKIKDDGAKVKIKSDAPKEERSVDQIAQAETDKLTKLVDLKEAQLKQVQDLNKMLAKKMSVSGGTPANRADAERSVNQYRENQYRQILSEEQFTMWKKSESK